MHFNGKISWLGLLRQSKKEGRLSRKREVGHLLYILVKEQDSLPSYSLDIVKPSEIIYYRIKYKTRIALLDSGSICFKSFLEFWFVSSFNKTNIQKRYKKFSTPSWYRGKCIAIFQISFHLPTADCMLIWCFCLYTTCIL